ncbi:proline-rich protein 2-like [Micropterus dolomieu]|uniref:proline-rich protein 2-like n=1 Tax=Micropterus dolomieu TaxID=147949 RepID=UPI001E8E33AA|nr:proline-rich protein 2-like [Micropterus dolomieu]
MPNDNAIPPATATLNARQGHKLVSPSQPGDAPPGPQCPAPTCIDNRHTVALQPSEPQPNRIMRRPETAPPRPAPPHGRTAESRAEELPTSRTSDNLTHPQPHQGTEPPQRSPKPQAPTHPQGSSAQPQPQAHQPPRRGNRRRPTNGHTMTHTARTPPDRNPLQAPPPTNSHRHAPPLATPTRPAPYTGPTGSQPSAECHHTCTAAKITTHTQATDGPDAACGRPPRPANTMPSINIHIIDSPTPVNRIKIPHARTTKNQESIPPPTPRPTGAARSQTAIPTE